MEDKNRSSPKGIVVALVASLIVLAVVGYAYSGVSASFGREQSSLSALGAEVRSLQTSSSPDTATTILASTTTQTNAGPVTTTTTDTVTVTAIGPQTTTTVCTTNTSRSQSSTATEQAYPCGNIFPASYQVNFAVTPSGAGTVNPPTNTTAGIQRQGILIQITAAANTGYSFTSWTATSASITFGCASCTTTSAEIDGSGTILANFAAQNGPAYVTETCSAHGLDLKIVSCTLPTPVVKGQTILLETAVVPPTSVADSMGNQFTLLEQTGCPCSSTYMLQVYAATASASGPDAFTVQGPGNFDALLVHVITGVIGVAGASIGSGTSATAAVAAFQPPSGSLVVGVGLINNTEGAFNSTVNAGPGYRLLTVGPSIVDEDGISSGNATTSQFSLQQPERWAEVSVVFITADTVTTTSTMGENMLPRASTGLGSFAVVVLSVLGSVPGSAASRRSPARFGKTVLSDAPS
jgi:Divergent InlB B-repeat domain